jgi:3-hydroxypropanoate dehydrogenase
LRARSTLPSGSTNPGIATPSERREARATGNAPDLEVDEPQHLVNARSFRRGDLGPVDFAIVPQLARQHGDLRATDVDRQKVLGHRGSLRHYRPVALRRTPAKLAKAIGKAGSMGERVDDSAMDILFRTARSHMAWQPRPVTDETLQELYDLLKWAPTSANASPARFAFLRSKEAKERLRPALAPLNVEKTMTAPVTVIVAYDLKFYEQLPKLFPHNTGMVKMFQGNPELTEVTAKRNCSLQGAYLILAARALGLDCGPMSGFDNAKVDEEFFAAGQPCFGCEQEFFPEGHVKSNFLCNLGYGEPSKVHPRLPRLPFNEACSIL